MKWTEIAERIKLQQVIVDKMLECEKSFDRAKYAEDIEALSDPLKVTDEYPILLEKLAPDTDNVKMLLCQFYAAELMWDKYKAKGIPEDIFFASMEVHTRSIEETLAYNGSYIIDRVFWTYRQVSMTIFRLGALEYELKQKEHVIGIHIPSDADFRPESVKASLKQIIPFCRKYFPDFADADITCGTWLLSDVLKELLPPTSNILHFQELFEDVECEHESKWYIRFLFQMNNDTPYEQLREETSLQRKAKQLLLSGRNIGTGHGRIKAEYR